ncbi:MAG: hypothetical protein LC107_03680 [Chitinophagales bacterium]|nr:hypothetical protein [Chitinophagales bacterium]
MKERILDFRRLLTIVLVVVCFWGDQLSTFKTQKAGVQNLNFIERQNAVSDIKDSFFDVAYFMSSVGMESEDIVRNQVKHTFKKGS